MATPKSSEQFEAVLREIRDESEERMHDVEDHEKGSLEEVRAMWHTAEFALTMLSKGRYLPKRAAQIEATLILRNLPEAP